jgi:poly(hydroxyalkanoate) granule-associated protein
VKEEIMAKKKLRKKVQRKPEASKFAAPVVDSAREIWLAGLGAFAVAQEEGEKIRERGTKFFDRLVEEGSKLQKKTRKDVDGAVSDIRGEFEKGFDGLRDGVEKRVDDFRGDVEHRFDDIRGEVEGRFEGVRKQANDNWDKLEKIFEDRVARALGSLGIPTQDDINKLTKRVRELSRQVADLDKKTKRAAAKPKVAKKPVARKPAARKPAAKAAPVSKPAAEKTKAA